jgi:glutathione S-transferase
MEKLKPRRVWGIGTPRTMRAHWTLCELGLEYETKPIITRTPAMRSPDFRALSQREKIPLLEDGDLMIGESAAIALHLAERYRGCGNLAPPMGSDARAHHDELCFFVMTEMDAILYLIRRHEGLSEIYGKAETACTAARGYFQRSAEEIERRLSQHSPYLLGEDFQVADLLLKTCLDWAEFTGISHSEPLLRYSQSIAERPAYAAAMAVNFTPEAMAALS